MEPFLISSIRGVIAKDQKQTQGPATQKECWFHRQRQLDACLCRIREKRVMVQTMEVRVTVDEKSVPNNDDNGYRKKYRDFV
jgi:hypothetical protein